MNLGLLSGKQVEKKYGFTREALYHAARRGAVKEPTKIGGRTFWDSASVDEAVAAGRIRLPKKRKLRSTGQIEGNARPLKRQPGIQLRADYPAIIEDIGRNLNRSKTALQLASEHSIRRSSVYVLADKLKALGVHIPDAMQERVDTLASVAAKLLAEQKSAAMSVIG